MKLRRLRDGDVLENGDIVLVRGGDLDPDVLCADAARYYSVYGVYGISVFAVLDVTVDELAQQVPLVRFDRLTSFQRYHITDTAVEGSDSFFAGAGYAKLQTVLPTPLVVVAAPALGV